MKRNGWYQICGCYVYVRKGKVLCGMKRGNNGQLVPVYPFRLMRYGWTPAGKLTVPAFKAGMNRNTIIMM